MALSKNTKIGIVIACIVGVLVLMGQFGGDEASDAKTYEASLNHQFAAGDYRVSFKTPSEMTWKVENKKSDGGVMEYIASMPSDKPLGIISVTIRPGGWNQNMDLKGLIRELQGNHPSADEPVGYQNAYGSGATGKVSAAEGDKYICIFLPSNQRDARIIIVADSNTLFQRLIKTVSISGAPSGTTQDSQQPSSRTGARQNARQTDSPTDGDSDLHNTIASL